MRKCKEGIITDRGRAWVLAPEHPRRKFQRIKRAWYVMEKHLGRYLERTECVHHINGDTMDDNLENLMVVSKSEHFRLHNEKGGNGTGKTMTRVCLWCGGNFKINPYEVTRGRGKHCSLKCRIVACVERRTKPFRLEQINLFAMWDVSMNTKG
jgi:hypothetical protein